MGKQDSEIFFDFQLNVRKNLDRIKGNIQVLESFDHEFMKYFLEKNKFNFEICFNILDKHRERISKEIISDLENIQEEYKNLKF